MLTTVLFYVIFGGFGGEDEELELARIQTTIVNLDEGQVFTPESGVDPSMLQGVPGMDLAGVVSMGDLVTKVMLSGAFSDLLAATQAADAEAARAAVDRQETGVVVIIPPNFSEALTQPDAGAVVELYHDPDLTIGPVIVGSILGSLMDNLMSSKITIEVALEQYARAGGTITPQVINELVTQASAAASQALANEGAGTVVMQELDSGREVSFLSSLLGIILSGMAIFYLFFTGAATSQSILTEEEKGTLPRLFTTPTPTSTILNGKILAVFVILIVQISVLLVFGRFVFNIYWGEPLQVVLIAVTSVILAGTMGMFIISWLTNSRQGGVVFGGVLTLTGMLGMVTVFTGGSENVPQAMETASLLVPQGWAVRSFSIAMDGGSMTELLPFIGGILVWALVFGVIAQVRLQRRYG
jgi:ABC-2 type transport system permease protein